MEALARETGELSKTLINRPQLREDLRIYWEAFGALSLSRPVGMGIGPIPLSEVFAYCQLYEIDGEDRDEMVRFIRAMDDEFLKIHTESKKSKEK